MKLLKILTTSILILLTACGGNMGYNFDNPFKGSNAHKKQVEIAPQSSFPYELEPVGNALSRAFTNIMLERNLAEYDFKLQRILEEKHDGKSFNFLSKDKTLKASIELKDSFKIIEKNIYCREYFQTVEYMGEIISNTAVACRGSKKVWKNLRVIN